MGSISGSVGRRGRNISVDVITVQKLLNENMAEIAPVRLAEDGRCGPLTIGGSSPFNAA